jgi:hypothetical protein
MPGFQGETLRGKRMKKENRLTPEDYAALLERLKTESLKEGDGEILKAVLEKTLLIGKKYREGKITSKKRLRRLMAIPRPEKWDDER